MFAIVAALLAACGIGLNALGVVMLGEGRGAGVVGVLCGIPVCYAAYVFARAAVRERRQLHRHPLSADERGARKKKVSSLLGSAAALIVGAFVQPIPGVLRVVMIFAALFAVPVLLALEFEPPKHRPGS
ncbi:MAG TPA: hypothetical protein VGH79_06650 [Gaiellaceae bacterium]